MRPWYKITAQVDPTVAELHIFDEIGKSFFNDEAVTAAQCLADLAALPEAVTTLRVLVNSPGGSPWEASAIANALRAQRLERGRTVETQILGLAASAATIITSAGAPIRMAANAVMMIHNPHALVLGDAREMTKMAGALETVKQAIIAAYRWVSPRSAAELGRLMDEETWMDAATAVRHGLATEVMAAEAVAAHVRPEALARLGQVPAAYRARIAALAARPAERARARIDHAAVYARYNTVRAELPAEPAAASARRARSFPEMARDCYGGRA